MFALRIAAGTLLLAGVLVSASCDKAKLAVDAAREKFRGAADPNAPAAPGGDVAPDLASQVDSGAEGVRFRRDLPFPTNLRVKLTETRSIQNGRVSSISALGNESSSMSVDLESVCVLDRRGPSVGVVVERFGIVEPPVEGEKKQTAPDQASKGALPRISFEQSARGWRLIKTPGPMDFGTKLREQAILPRMDELMIMTGLAPRRQWFSASRRWAAGDRLVLEGDSLQMFFPQGTKGKLTLVYEVAEPINGHPCGRFSVSGDFSIKGDLRPNGNLVDRDATIKSGKIWCSLLYPLVLRTESDSVLTESEGSGEGAKTKLQGGVKDVSALNWEKASEG
jgi:hypothetical protein